MKDNRYFIMNLSEENLRKELTNWTRINLINWLKWNDPNGIYDDASSIDEFNNIMSKEEGIEIVVRQVIQEKLFF